VNKTMLVALLFILVNSGCMSWFDTRSVTAPVHPSASQGLPKGPITADLVEAGNAHRLADAVWDEMARDERKETAATDKKQSVDAGSRSVK